MMDKWRPSESIIQLQIRQEIALFSKFIALIKKLLLWSTVFLGLYILQYNFNI